MTGPTRPISTHYEAGVRIAGLLTLAAVGACGPGDGESAWSTSVDTLAGGAVHVVNTPPAGGVDPTWVLEEELRIGTIDEAGPSSFGQVKGIAPLENGGVAVLDAQAQELRLFDGTGAHRATFGGKGSGPGEMEGAFGLMVAPDGRLWVPDHQNARMSIYDPAAGFERSYPLRVVSRGFIWGGVMGRDGRIFKPSITLAEDRREVVRVYDQAMNPVDSLPMPERPDIDQDDPPNAFAFGSRESGRWGFYGVPYFPQRRQAIDPWGQVWTTKFGDPSYRVSRSAPGGDTTLVLETARAPVPVTEAERDSVIEEVRTALLEQGGANQDWSKIPDVKPAVEAMFFDEEGRLWVRTPTPDSLLTYDIYERDGRYAGTAVSSVNIYPWLSPVVRGDTFWAVVTDELDVQYVVRARLRDAHEPEAG